MMPWNIHVELSDWADCPQALGENLLVKASLLICLASFFFFSLNLRQFFVVLEHSISPSQTTMHPKV